MGKLRFKAALLMLFIFSAVSFGQQSKLEKADKKFEKLAYIDAIEIYKELASEGYESYEVYKKIADAYYFNAKYSDAGQWYQKITEKYKDSVAPEHYFRYAQTLRAVKEYGKADDMMTVFSELSGQDFRASLFKEKPDYIRVEGYRVSDYTIDVIRELNSRFSDFGPSYYKDQVIFASARDSGSYAKRIHKWNNQPFLDLYTSRLKDDGSMTPPRKFDNTLNSIFHESTSCFTQDGNTVYFTRNNFTSSKFGKSKGGINMLKIYRSVKVNDKWKEAVEVPFNGADFSVAHPALNASETKLYFASDRPGTLGQSDIWVVDILEGGAFSEPRNLGRPINTEGRESFPFMSQKGNLYFASDGHPGLGGLDIFVTAPESEELVVLGVGAPINSSSDDFAFVVKDSLKKGFFSSSRKRGMGSDDIYKFVQKERPEPSCDVPISGVISDGNVGTILSDATVHLLDINNELIEEVAVDASGNYQFMLSCSERYIIRASSPLYYAKEVLVTSPSKPETLKQDISLELRHTQVKQGDDLAKLLNLKPIYFDFNRFNIRPDASLELLKVVSAMKQIPSMSISSRSHTDSRGRDAYNLALSDKRAKATVAYIISQGIDASRITGQGYGETELVNKCANGVECSEEEHQLNRRSEFIVINQ